MSWENIVDKLDDLAAARIDNEGFRVRAVTDLGTSTVIYDADSPDTAPNPLTPNIQIVLENRKGEIISQFGDRPKFSILKSSVIYGGALLFTIVTIKGIAGFIK